MLNAALYDEMMETSNAIYTALATLRGKVDPPPPILQLRAGRAESPGWYLVQAAEFAPQPLTVELLRVRDIYASERMAAAILEIMASEGWLDRAANGEYHLADPGRAVLARSRERRRLLHAQLMEMKSALAPEIEALVTLLKRLIDVSLRSDPPPETWCLAHSRNRAPEESAPLLERLVQYFDDFNAFRDDAHMAAYKPLGVAGYAWEAFTFVCSGEAPSIDNLFENLAHRGYSRTEYADALRDLAVRGWLTEADATSFNVTEFGRKMRAEVEARTDQYFYAPWTCLTTSEKEEIPLLMKTLRDHLG